HTLGRRCHRGWYAGKSRGIPGRRWRNLSVGGMTTAIYRHPDCAAHDMGGGHPERPARMQAVDRAIDALNQDALVYPEVPLADYSSLKRVHDAGYVDRIAETAPASGRVPLDGDTAM